MSFFRATPSCPNHPWTPSHAVGIWAEPFEQRTHPVGLASGEQRWEIWFFCRAYPEKMVMATRHTEGQSTHLVCSLDGYLIVSLYGSGFNKSFFSAMQGAGGGDFSTCSGVSYPTQKAVAVTLEMR